MKKLFSLMSLLAICPLLMAVEELPERGRNDGYPAEPPAPEREREPGPDILYYQGQMVDNIFLHILFKQKHEYVPSFIRVVAINNKLGPIFASVPFIAPVTLEWEGQLARHTGLQEHHEANLALFARREWIWSNLFSFSMGYGNGLSYATRIPRLEQEENPDARAFLSYMMAEFVFGAPGLPHHPRLMFRIHHRSGIYGLFCTGTCGSNILTYGIKLGF